jgi:hypothetical protein
MGGHDRRDPSIDRRPEGQKLPLLELLQIAHLDQLPVGVGRCIADAGEVLRYRLDPAIGHALGSSDGEVGDHGGVERVRTALQGRAEPDVEHGGEVGVEAQLAMSFAYFVHIVLVWAVDSFWVVSRADGSGSIT